MNLQGDTGDTEVSAGPWSLFLLRGAQLSSAQLTQHLAASGTPQKCEGAPGSCLCHVPAVLPNRPGCWKGRLSCLPGTGEEPRAGEQGLCHPPSPGQSPVPNATAPGAGSARGRCRPHVCPTRGSCCGLSPALCQCHCCQTPLIPTCSHPTARGSPGPSAEPSLLEQQLRERRSTELTAGSCFLQLCPLSSLGQGPQDKSMAPGHTG